MLDLEYLRNNLDTVKKKVSAKGIDFDEHFFTKLDKQRRQLITNFENLKHQKKKIDKEIGILKSKNNPYEELQRQSIGLSEEITKIEEELKVVEKSFQNFLHNIPNMFADTVPIGKDESDNIIVREWGEKPKFNFTPRPHWELGKINNFLDLSRAAKISGSRFALYFDALAKLERILINFMIDITTNESGYQEILPPFLVNEKSLFGTGNLPKFKDDLFKIEDYNLFLVPTAEVPLTNIHRDEVLEEKELPKKYVAYTPCFRSEAGSHGKDIRGIIRQHQFNKVEMLKFTSPKDSYKELDKLTLDAEKILQKLNLHYRVMLLCTGDMSFSAAKTFDIEVWMPARNGYIEISSCSNFESFQSRRAKIRYKNDKGKKDFVHTLNGSGLAVGRTVAAIMENYQTREAKIEIPEVLRTNFFQESYL